MKKLITMLFLASSATGLHAQWTGSTVATTTLGKIGAGTNSPDAMVHIVAGNSTTAPWVSGLHINNYSGTSNNGYVVAVYNNWSISPPLPPSLLFGIDLHQTIIPNRLAIGTNPPSTYNLSVAGDASITQSLQIGTTALSGYSLSVGGKAYIAQSLRVGAKAASGAYAAYMLSVDGDIIAKRCVIQVDYWADYVFGKHYVLPTLTELEQFINENGHLPGVPTEAEVKENGIDIGAMNKVLTQKVEELTLYMIQLKKENEAIKAKLEELSLKDR